MGVCLSCGHASHDGEACGGDYQVAEGLSYSCNCGHATAPTKARDIDEHRSLFDDIADTVDDICVGLTILLAFFLGIVVGYALSPYIALVLKVLL